MSTTPGVGMGGLKRRASDLIGRLPSRNLHFGIRLARRVGLDLNQHVSFNFSLTACPPDRADLAFARLRAAFGKWARRPQKSRWTLAVPPTFVWVIENPDGCLNAHWLVHVPDERLAEFKANLPKWLEAAVGEVYSEKAIHVRPVTNVVGLQKYLLKGLHPALARQFKIDHSNQGWVTGRRIGHSKNIGPRQVKKMRDLGLFPMAQRWV